MVNDAFTAKYSVLFSFFFFFLLFLLRATETLCNELADEYVEAAAIFCYVFFVSRR